MTPELYAAADKAKQTALSRLLISNRDGTVNVEETLLAFQDLLAKEAEKISAFNRKVQPAVESLFNENPTEFISSDNVKFFVRRTLDKAAVEASADEINNWLEQAVKSGYLYSRRGRGGGLQLFDNALQITARYLAKNKEITADVIEEARKKMTKDADGTSGS